MAKALLYDLFGFGEIPGKVREEIKRQDILLEDEGVRSSITFRNYRAPGKFFGLKKRSFIGSVFLTKDCLQCHNGANTLVYIPFRDEEALNHIALSLKGEHKLSVKIDDASYYNPDTSGQVEYVFSTPLAEQLLENYDRMKSTGGLLH